MFISLLQFRSEGGMRACCQNWKHYTSRRINDALGTSGQFWQPESFDHLVRSPEQFEYLRGYIEQKPNRREIVHVRVPALSKVVLPGPWQDSSGKDVFGLPR